MKTCLQLLVYVLIFTLMVKFNVQAQQTQTLKGIVTDKESRSPLVGVTIVVWTTDPKMGATTDENGEFKISQVPQGRHQIKVSYLGYGEQNIPNVMLTSGKEMMLDIQLTEQVTQVDEVVVKANSAKQELNNEMSIVSARSFNMEEAMRYAGSLNDPSRMAANFAGVSGANDGRNDIIIRGNSPLGLLWRLEGIEIPNPNHFGSQGSTGGPVSMLNTNLLGKSDFMTGAFAANYGNATSGVFDLSLRRGNNEKREHLFQIGFNGFELGTEGPFSKKSKASYMINYRYSTLGVFNALGMDFGTGAAIPQYQDINLKIDLPTAKAGKFTLFGLGGLSYIELLDSKVDTTKSNRNFYNDGNRDIYFRSNMGVIGASHMYFLTKNISSKLVIAANGTQQPTKIDSLVKPTSLNPKYTFIPDYRGSFNTHRLSANYSINAKLSRKNNLNSGINIDRIGFSLRDSFNISDTSVIWRKIRDDQGTNYLTQIWTQWQHKTSDRFSLTFGLHYQHFSLNGSQVLEPRFGTRYTLNEKSSIHLGLGIHNQTQPLFVYYQKTQLSDGSYTQTNRNLGFTESRHIVLGYDRTLHQNWRLKAEVYYQYVTNIPVEQKPSTFSLVNVGADFNIPSVDSLVNNGKGQNYGLEFTLERYFSQGFYFLNTISVFDSKYSGSDGVLRNTAYNGNYVWNILGGYEHRVSKKGTLSVDVKSTVAGGRRVTPIDLEASRTRRATVYMEDKPFSEQLPAYFRTDLRIGYRLDRAKVSHQWAIQFNNLTNQKNVFSRRFSTITNDISDIPQLSFMVIPQYRLLF